MKILPIYEKEKRDNTISRNQNKTEKKLIS